MKGKVKVVKLVMTKLRGKKADYIVHLACGHIVNRHCRIDPPLQNTACEVCDKKNRPARTPHA
jgi:hypothetical protein